MNILRSSHSPGRTYGKSSPRLEVRAAEEAFDKLVEDDQVAEVEDDKVAEVEDMLQDEESLQAGEVGCLENEASPGLRKSKGRVS